MEIPIIYKDKNYLVLNKPAGVLVHPVNLKAKSSKLKAEFTLASWLLENHPEVKNVGDPSISPSGEAVYDRPGIVHRLDRETSGVMIIARNQETFDFLKNIFQKREAQKTYSALVYGRVKDKTGRIDKPMGILSGTIRRSVTATKMVKPAVTDYEVIKYLNIDGKDFTLLDVMPRTGRTHQIRVHLSSIGHPVMGDKVYGGKRGILKGLDRQFLHARAIEFTSPSGERVKFEADLPEELAEVLESGI